MKIKVKTIGDYPIEIIDKGDWIDLRATKTIEAKIGQYKAIPLNVAMKLPAGYEAIIVPRSSSFKHYGFIQANSVGVMDNSYCGDSEQWHMLAYFPSVSSLRKGCVKGDRVAQFRIQLSQRATRWQKLRHLFRGAPRFEFVDVLDDEDRGGIGSTGKR